MILEARAITVRYRRQRPGRAGRRQLPGRGLGAGGRGGSQRQRQDDPGPRAAWDCCRWSREASLVDGRPVEHWSRRRARPGGRSGRSAGGGGLPPQRGRDGDAGPLRPAGAAGGPRRGGPERGPAPPSSAATSSTWRTDRLTPCRAASGSGYGSRARWPRSPGPSCWTSRPPRSTCATRWSCSSSSASWSTQGSPALSSLITSTSPPVSRIGSSCSTVEAVVAEGAPARGAEPGHPLSRLRVAGSGNHLVGWVAPGGSTRRAKESPR